MQRTVSKALDTQFICYYISLIYVPKIYKVNR